MIQVLGHHLTRAQARMKQRHDKTRYERTFQVGYWVYLKLQPYRQNTIRDRQFQKLSTCFYGPFKTVDKFGEVAYKLQLPSDNKLHPVFHVSQLKKSVNQNQQLNMTLPIMGNATLLEPLKILDHKMANEGNHAATQVLVQLTNLFKEDAMWED